MGKKCIISGCEERSYKYAFPKRHELQRTLWIDAVRPYIKESQLVRRGSAVRIRREEWTPSQSCIVCPKHFVGGIKSSYPGRKGYVPAIFPAAKPKDSSTYVPYDPAMHSPSTVIQPIRPYAERIKRLEKPLPGNLCTAVHTPSTVIQPVKSYAERIKRMEKPLPGGNLCTAVHNTPTVIQPIRPYAERIKRLENPFPGRPGRPPKLINANPFTRQVPIVIDHDYLPGASSGCCPPPPPLTETEKLRKEIQELQDRVATLENRLICLKTVKKSDQDLKYFTGFPNYGTFYAFYQYVEDKARYMKMWRCQDLLQHRPHSSWQRERSDPPLDLEESFFMVLVRLKTGMSMEQLSRLFGVSIPDISRAIASWINLLLSELKHLCELPAKSVTTQNRCESFRDSGDLRIILDCTELFTKTSDDDKETVNDENAYKFLVVLSPQCTVTYVSSLSRGTAGDKEIVETSTEVTELIEAMEDGGIANLADQGFQNVFTCDFNSCNVDLVTPAFEEDDHCDSDEEDTTYEKICNAKTQAQRILGHIKSFQILSGDLMLTMKDIAEQVFIVCSYLANFQTPVMKKLCDSM